MWKRLQGHVREKDKQVQISNPVLVETTYDQDQLDRNPDVTNLRKPDQQNYVLPSLDSLSLPSPEPQSNRESKAPSVPRIQRISAVPTEPSIYSRASIEFYYYSNPAATLRSTYDDLSPPSSPEPEKFIPSFDPPSSSHSICDTSLRDFSPMDEKHRKLQDDPRDPTTAPVLRRAPSVLRTGEVQSGPKQKFWEGKLAPNSKVKWDEYSGEPNSAGKAPSVDPGSYVIGGPSASLRPMGYQVSVTAAAATEKKSLSFGERLTRFGSKRSPTVPAAVKQRLAEKSLQIPQRTASPSSDPERSNTSTPGLDRTPKLSDTRPVTAQTVDLDLHEETIKPVVPLKVEKKSPTGSRLTSPTSPTPHGLGISAFAYPSPLTPKTRDDDKQSPTIVIGAEPPIHPAFRTATPPETDKPPIASQFSWSKYTHSAANDEHSPPPSPPLSASSSVLIRRRPIPHADRIPDSRPGNSKMLTPSGASTYSTVSTMSNTSKALPHPPTALCALDHIALLESQQEDLRIRRNNVYRLLSDLNNAAPPNPLLTDFKKAKAIENKKKVFEVELDEIRREEHDVGLKLHRAWKKREKEDPNAAGSALWVRRVTS